jgi:hypothetical protein
LSAITASQGIAQLAPQAADDRSNLDKRSAISAEVERIARPYLLAMIQLPKDAPGEAACGYSGRSRLAVCSCGRRRSVPWRKLRTDFEDKTAIYGRPFKCKACQSGEETARAP